MKTYPDLSLSVHIQTLVEHLKKSFPELTENNFLFYDEADVHQSQLGSEVHKSKLMDREKFEDFFYKLCSEGREWINLSGDGWCKDIFIVSVEYSKKLNYPWTAILLGGPTLDINRKPLTRTRLNIIE